MIRSSLGLGGVALASALVFGCSSSTADTPATPAATQSTAAAVMGTADAHCGGKVVKVDPAACAATADAGQGDTGGDDFGDTMYGSAGNDDDCKYHLSWTSTPVTENAGVTFVLTTTNLIDGTPVTGGNPYIEAFLDERTPAPNSASTTTESPPGTYTIGPILFNQPGHWTVRFHIAGTCADAEDSPHGHGAFFVGVP